VLLARSVPRPTLPSPPEPIPTSTPPPQPWAGCASTPSIPTPDALPPTRSSTPSTPNCTTTSAAVVPAASTACARSATPPGRGTSDRTPGPTSPGLCPAHRTHPLGPGRLDQRKRLRPHPRGRPHDH